MSQYVQKVDYPGKFFGLAGGDFLQAIMQGDMFSKTEDMIFSDPKGLVSLFKRDMGDGLTGLKRNDAQGGHGAEVEWKLEAEQSGSYSAFNEGGDFAGPGHARYIRAYAPVRAFSGSIAVTGHSEAQTKDKRLALMSSLALEQKSLIRTQKDNAKRVLYGNGTGILGKVKTVISDSGGVAVVSLADGNAFPIPNDARFFFPGQLVTWAVSASTLTHLGSGRVNTAGNVAGKVDIGGTYYNTVSISYNNGVAPKANDIIVAGGRTTDDARYQSSWRNEFLGLGAVLDPTFEENYDGTDQLHGLGVAEFPLWKPVTYDFSGGGDKVNITPMYLLEATELYLHRNGEEYFPNFMATNPRLKLAYWNFLQSDVQYAGGLSITGGMNKEKTGFYGGVGTIPWIEDRYMPDGEVWMGRKEACQFIWWEKPGFLPLNGSGSYWRQSDVSSKKIAIYQAMGNFITTARWRMARFTGFEQTSTWIV